MTKTLVLIRHAHRDTTNRAADNGLSEKGSRQAAALLRYYVKAFEGGGPGSASSPAAKKDKPRIFSSPRKRCVETVTAIAREAGVRVETSAEFVEQRGDETPAELRERAGRFIEKWRAEKSAPAVTIVCSHGDWLPAALLEATGARAELKKGSWAEIHQEERGKPRLEWLIQSFKSRV